VEGDDLGPASAAAVAATIRRASSASPVRFRCVLGEAVEEPRGEEGLADPSPDFRRLCAEQLEIFRVLISRDAVLSVSLDLWSSDIIFSLYRIRMRIIILKRTRSNN
jgi:hypothetical protein